MAYIGQSLTEGTRRAYTFVATSGQTTFNAVYGVGSVDVYQNGILLQPSDYNSSSGSSVVLGVGAAVNDEITIIAHNTFSVADTVSSSQGGTFAGAITASNGLTVDDDGATPLTVDRATSDGTVIDVQKNGTSVGSIGNDGNDFYVTGSVANIAGIYLANSKAMPMKSGSVADGQSDLGNSSYRWKDLYLSGGAYLGGTGAANKLSDYEEGTWTPIFYSGGTSISYIEQYGRYTKIGRSVQAEFYLRGTITGNGNQLEIGGLPFTIASGTFARGWGGVGYESVIGTNSPQFYGTNNSNHFSLYYNGDSSYALANGTTASNQYLIGMFIYDTGS